MLTLLHCLADTPRNSSALPLDIELENLVPTDLGLQCGSPENKEVAVRMRREYFGEDVTPSDEQLAEVTFLTDAG